MIGGEEVPWEQSLMLRVEAGSEMDIVVVGGIIVCFDYSNT